jgi:uncharacterized protein YecT (DUF1311 family)
LVQSKKESPMKSFKGRIILLVLTLASAFTVTMAQTQTELNKRACDNYKAVDAEMNKVYQQILKEYRADNLFIQKLKAAQRAWLTYRDAQLEALYPAADTQVEYGSIYPACRCNALQEITSERTKVLRRWTEGVKEGDTCSGSIKVKE